MRVALCNPISYRPYISKYSTRAFFNSSIALNSSTRNFPAYSSIITGTYPVLRQRISKPNTKSSGSAGRAVRAMASGSTAPAKPFGVLFVCLGNICRSPSAEAVFQDAVKKRGLESMFRIDSAGTINYHEGNPADARMKAAAKKRGIAITSISRPISPSDFEEFDLILAMDKQNKADILEAYEEWKVKSSLPADARNKVKLMCNYCKRHNETEVPDPYYGGPQGFEKVLDILEDACESLLDTILENHFSNISKGAC